MFKVGDNDLWWLIFNFLNEHIFEVKVIVDEASAVDELQAVDEANADLAHRVNAELLPALTEKIVK